MKNHKIPEDVSAYCSVPECSDCTIPLCNRFGVVYEGCECEECEAQRNEMRKLLNRYRRI